MARLELAPDLVEEAVFQVTSSQLEHGDPRALAWFERRERLYELREPRAREEAFRRHALERFRALHLDEPLRLALEAAPSAAARLEALFVRRARRPRDEAAELYRAPDGSTRAVLPLLPTRFADVEALHALVRRELLYVDDMLDERFAYAPELVDRLPLEPGRRDVVRERVSRAWKGRVEARARGEAVEGRFEHLVEAAVRALAPSSAG